MRITVESWSPELNRLVPHIKKTASRVGRFLRIKSAKIEVMLVDDSFMKKNVLSFPAPKRFPGLHKGGKFLGEIYLNPDFIRKEGEKTEYMLIHGLLHLLGYDHKRKGDILKMEKLESELIQKFARS